MTDNEKAATFIGWRKGINCEEFRGPRPCRQNPSGIHMDMLHSVPAPDMANPRNYMKALEAFEGQPYSTEILGPYEHEGMWYAVEFDRPLDDYAGDSAAAGPTGRGRTIGEAFVAALAMLYDKQHTTQAGAEP